MFWIIVRREILGRFLDLRFSLSVVLVAFLMGAAGLLFTSKYKDLLDEYHEAQVRNRASLESVSGELRNLLYHRQVIPMKPSALRFLAEGDEDQLPHSAEAGIFGIRKLQSLSGETSILSGIGEVDWAFIVRLILSFVAVILPAWQQTGPSMRCPERRIGACLAADRHAEADAVQFGAPSHAASGQVSQHHGGCHRSFSHRRCGEPHPGKHL